MARTERRLRPGHADEGAIRTWHPISNRPSPEFKQKGPHFCDPCRANLLVMKCSPRLDQTRVFHSVRYPG